MMMMTMIAVNGDVNSLLLLFLFLRYIHVLSLSLPLLTTWPSVT